MTYLETCNIDIVAYLHLSGIEPERVRFVAKNVREFRYPWTRTLDAALKAYHANALVPVKSFTLARAEVKELNGGQTRRGLMKALAATEPHEPHHPDD